MSRPLMLRPIGLIVVFALSTAPTDSAARDCTTVQSTLQSSSNGPPCTAFDQRPSKSETWSVWIHTNCRDGGWREMNDGSATLNASAAGQCGIEESGGPPFCPGLIPGGPTDGGMSGGDVSVYVPFEDYVYDATYQTCILERDDRVEDLLAADGCEGNFCCGGDSACTNLGGFFTPTDCSCLFSPVILSLDAGGFGLTNAAAGAHFDLNRNGARERLAWTGAGSMNAFLALDRNGNGLIDDGGELFGSTTDQPASALQNGFSALAMFDGNADGMISRADAVFGSLRLWIDWDHNGASQPWELRPLDEYGISALGLDYTESKWRDRHGNIFRYRARVYSERGSRVRPWAWDVFLRGQPSAAIPCTKSASRTARAGASTTQETR
jgi:hypothetical protein